MKLAFVLFTITILASTFAVAQTGDREIAARFAPVFYQSLGDSPRGDYITNFDFDGDWRGDNNWRNTDIKRFRMLGYVYYAVSETRSHYFIHYAVFHARDYKGGTRKGVMLSELLRLGAETAGGKDPTGMLDEATVAHENDMEGALVVVDRETQRVAYVESLHHNKFSAYKPEDLKLENGRVLFYIEPKGHGIEALTDDRKKGEDILIYKYTGTAGDPEKSKERSVGYALLPISSTLWPHAAAQKEKSASFGTFHDYSEVTINVMGADGKPIAKKFKLGSLGSAFLGKAGGQNMARPPWGWFDNAHRGDPLGMWFFDPAAIIKRDFILGDAFSTAYTKLPFWTK